MEPKISHWIMAGAGFTIGSFGIIIIVGAIAALLQAIFFGVPNG